MVKLESIKEYRKLLVDAEVDSDSQMARLTGLPRAVVARFRKGGAVNMKAIGIIAGTLLDRMEVK